MRLDRHLTDHEYKQAPMSHKMLVGDNFTIGQKVSKKQFHRNTEVEGKASLDIPLKSEKENKWQEQKRKLRRTCK